MIRVALIGLGKMGISHLAIARAHPDVDLVAVCDTSSYTLGVLSKYAGLRTYQDYVKLLGAEALDAVIIATPSKYHGKIVQEALSRSLHVFCEKPFCLEVAEGEALVELAEEKKLVNQVGYHYRFVATFKEMKRLLDTGILGKLHNIRAETYGPVLLKAKSGNWRSSRSEGGGCLYDYASHAIDLMNYFVGRPVAVAGTALNRIFSRDVEDEVSASFFYRDGLTGQVVANWSDESHRKMAMKVTAWGTNGEISADRQEIHIYLRDASGMPEGLIKGWNVRYTTDLTEPVRFYLRGEEYSAQIDHFIAAIRTGSADTRSTFRSATDVDAVVAAMVKDAEDVNDRVLVENVTLNAPGRRGLWQALRRGHTRSASADSRQDRS